MSRRGVLPFFGVVSAAVLVTVTAVSASADDVQPSVSVAPRPSVPAPLVDAGAFPEASLLTLPAIPDEIMAEASRIAERFEDDPQVASVGISLDRSQIEVYWFGEVTPELDNVVASSESSVAVLDSTYSPKLLRDTATQLLNGDAGTPVSSVTIKADGAGLEVSLTATRSTPLRSTPIVAAQQQVADFAAVPISFEAAPQSASRQSDTNHIGGARIYQYEPGKILNSCSTAFAAIEPQSGKKYMLTAAHCGQIGSTWVVPDGVAGSNTYYMYGSVTGRNELHDVAVIDTTYSYPFIYTSAWNSDVSTAINGLTNPVVGTEICYSGSYSGLVCGNIVTSSRTIYTMATGQSSTQSSYAYKTVQNAGVPSAGNGDSGGPGYVLTSTGAGYKRYAATIISAIQSATPTCTGVAGGGGRSCSSTVLTTSVDSALTNQGLSLQISN